MKWILTGILALAWGKGVAQVELDLQKCRELAIENSRIIAVAEQKNAKAAFDRKAYRANFFPKISGMGMYAYMQKDFSFQIDGGYLPTFLPGADGTFRPNVMLDPATGRPVTGADGQYVFNQYAFMPDIALVLGLDHAYTLGGMLEQPLYMGGKIRSAYRMATVGLEMSELNIRYSRAEVLTETDEVYWQCVRLKELLISVVKYKEVVSELVRNLSDAYQTGMASRNDLLKAQVKENEAELMLRKAQHGKKLAEMNLCRVLGMDPECAVQLNDTLDGVLDAGILDGPRDITARPEYNILDKELELKRQQVELTRADFLPQLGISASYGYTDGIAVNGEANGIASFTAMASLKVPVFHWNEGRNKVKAMKAEEEITELTKQDLVEKMQLEAARARFNVEDALSRVKLTLRSVEQARENLQDSRNRYEVGMETLTHYMEAQAQWQKAWSDWIDAKAELKLSETYYLRATGRLGE